MDRDELYERVSKALAKGQDVEIRQKPDGSWVVYAIKRNKVL